MEWVTACRLISTLMGAALKKDIGIVHRFLPCIRLPLACIVRHHIGLSLPSSKFGGILGVARFGAAASLKWD